MSTRIIAGLFLVIATSGAAWADDADKARAMLDRVVVEVGRDQATALAMFTKGENGFRDGDIYPFCFKVDDGLVVTGQTAGRDIRTFAGGSGQQLFDAAQKPEAEVTRLEYPAPKPGAADRTPTKKVTFVRRVGALGCGVGYYP